MVIKPDDKCADGIEITPCRNSRRFHGGNSRLRSLFLNCDELRLRCLKLSINTGEAVIGYSMLLIMNTSVAQRPRVQISCLPSLDQPKSKISSDLKSVNCSGWPPAIA